MKLPEKMADLNPFFGLILGMCKSNFGYYPISPYVVVVATEAEMLFWQNLCC